jgi:glycosyltransferase involved in cell wall biosynthesis
MPLLSVIVPVYNEAGTIGQILERIQAVDLDKEIVVVDDGSTDGTDRILRYTQGSNLKVIHHMTNRGKGASVLTGLSHASGDFVIIQDADLEYDPNDYRVLIQPMQAAQADIILGVRFTARYQGLLLHRLGNRFLTSLVNILFGVSLNDCFTCYKLMRRETFLALSLSCQGFDIETEIVSKAIRRKLRILEVPVRYRPRSFSEGKKIRIKDGFWAAWGIIRLWLKTSARRESTL